METTRIYTKHEHPHSSGLLGLWYFDLEEISHSLEEPQVHEQVADCLLALEITDVNSFTYSSMSIPKTYLNNHVHSTVDNIQHNSETLYKTAETNTKLTVSYFIR